MLRCAVQLQRLARQHGTHELHSRRPQQSGLRVGRLRLYSHSQAAAATSVAVARWHRVLLPLMRWRGLAASTSSITAVIMTTGSITISIIMTAPHPSPPPLSKLSGAVVESQYSGSQLRTRRLRPGVIVEPSAVQVDQMVRCCLCSPQQRLGCRIAMWSRIPTVSQRCAVSPKSALSKMLILPH